MIGRVAGAVFWGGVTALFWMIATPIIAGFFGAQWVRK